MNSGQPFLELVEETSITRTYKRESPPGRPINVIVSADDERIKVYSPEVPLFSPLKFNIKSYYPEKGLEQKVDRAVIEYLGMLNDLNSLGC